MYAIIKTGGKQYRVAKGDILKVEKLPQAEKKKVVFSEVLFVGDEKKSHVGTPFVKDAVVEGKVLSTGKSDKVIVYKYKSKKDYRRKQGHRQPYTEVEITGVSIKKPKQESSVAEKATSSETASKKAPAKKSPAKKADDQKAAKPAAKKAPAKTKTETASKKAAPKKTAANKEEA